MYVKIPTKRVYRAKGDVVLMSSYIALYRKWRPAVFADVYGQEHITDVLRGEIIRGSVSHAYLFCGSRGTGKTTCAKILAKAVSCLSPVNGDPCGECENCKSAATSFDISEIDAASNNGVDNIRELREEVMYPPTELKRRVYIIDEVHMLSTGAFNALLKTLEEPPEHAMFILATTELNKIPATILSRCKRFDFHRITPDNIARRLRFICDEEKIPMTDGAIKLISRLAGGAMRDALSMLELFVGKKEEIDEEACSKALGVIGRGPVMKLLKAVAASDCSSALSVIREAYDGSKDMGVLLSECCDAMRDMLMIKYTSNPENFVEGSEDVLSALSECAEHFTKERLIYSTEILNEAQEKMAKSTFSRRAVLETCIIRLCDLKLWTVPESLNTRISELEAKISSGNITVKAVTNDTTSVPKVSTKATPTPPKEPVSDNGTDAVIDRDIPIDTDHFDVPPENDSEMPPFDIEGEPDNNKASESSVKQSDTVGRSDSESKASPAASRNNCADILSGASPLSALPEILDEVRTLDKLLGSLMVNTKGYITSDGRVIICLPSFAKTMIHNDMKKHDIIVATTKKYMGDVDVRIVEQGKEATESWDL